MIISNKNKNYLCVLQKECVISNKYPAITGIIGSCYIITGYDPNTKYIFKTHIDACTKCEDIPLIFEKLKELKVTIANLFLNLAGGWKTDEKSKFLGNKIIEQLKILKVYKNTNRDYLWKKEANLNLYLNEDDLETIEKCYFLGTIIYPQNGEFKLLTKPWKKLYLKQQQIDEKYLKKCALIQQKILEIALTAETIPETLEIEGETIKNFGNNKMMDFRIIGKIHPLKISVI